MSRASSIDWFADISSQFVHLIKVKPLNPLTPVSDQNRISPYYIYTISCRKAMRIKKNINYEITNWSDTKFSKLTQWESFGRQ